MMPMKMYRGRFETSLISPILFAEPVTGLLGTWNILLSDLYSPGCRDSSDSSSAATVKSKHYLVNNFPILDGTTPEKLGSV
jgi:hypothetical protein